uniref:Bone marrow stromal antigen 2 n=1 Tax=Moschus moschiferus TaxID=68415 RepID=A0A8C6E7V4_MOSMO
MSESVMPNKEKDMSESALCDRKLPLWLGFLLLLAAVGLLAPLVYFAVRANSKTCLDGLQAQKECLEVNQHLQRQLKQAQEVSHEKEAAAATCKQTVVTLRNYLKEEQARVEELQGELATLNQQLHDLREKLRRQREDNASSSSVMLFLLLLAGVVMTCKCLKK